MSPAVKKLATVSVLIAVAVAGFIVLKPGDDDDNSTSNTITSPVTTTPTQAPERPPTTAPSPTPVPRTVVIRTVGGAAVGAVRKITVSKGDSVRIDVTSDVAEEVHVHGYDRAFAIPAGDRAKVRFRASIDGRFEIELEASGTPIAELTVSP